MYNFDVKKVENRIGVYNTRKTKNENCNKKHE